MLRFHVIHKKSKRKTQINLLSENKHEKNEKQEQVLQSTLIKIKLSQSKISDKIRVPVWNHIKRNRILIFFRDA